MIQSFQKAFDELQHGKLSLRRFILTLQKLSPRETKDPINEVYQLQSILNCINPDNVDWMRDCHQKLVNLYNQELSVKAIPVNRLQNLNLRT